MASCTITVGLITRAKGERQTSQTPTHRKCIIKPNQSNWKTIQLTGIAIRRVLGDIIIVPVIGPEGQVWQRFDQGLLQWSTPSVSDIIEEVDAAWADEDLKVDILTHDLPLDEETGSFIPFGI
tara:strand:+ start:188 stop:556 length:369 start_codon:yes stop_codon:yes gene_type:complete